MIEYSENKNEFTAQDFERYYSGKMSSLEMHQLEKAAMEDPFLADALEGYQYTTAASEESASLHAQLQSKLEAGKVVPINNNDLKQFLRIAALFILLAGCGFVVYQFAFNNTNDDLASAKSINNSAVAIDSSTEKAVSEADLTYSTANSNSNKQTTTLQRNTDGTVAITTLNRHTGRINNTPVSHQKEQTEISARMEQPAKAKDDRIASGTDARMQRVQDNTTDSFTYNEQTVTPGPDKVIVMRRSKADPMPEVVLNARKKDSTYRKPHVTFEEAEPVAGYASYENYVANNLQMPGEKMKKNISGEVKLSFDIDDVGQAVNIQVEKSLCAECDKEAIRLLREGPKLSRKNKKTKGKLRIQF